MSNSIITKEAIVRGFLELLQNNALSDISVKELCGACHISRNTFYYHFQDKYEVMCCIFDMKMKNGVEYYQNPMLIKQNIVDMCKCMITNRSFCDKCFKYDGQNSLYEYLHLYIYHAWKHYVETKFHEKGMTYEKQEIQLIISSLTHAVMGMLTSWMKDGMDAEQLPNISVSLEMFSPEQYVTLKKQKREKVEYIRRKVG